MTNAAALQAVLAGIAYDTNTGLKALMDAGIDGEGTYSKEAALSLDGAALVVLEGLLSAPNVSEGGYSVSYDRRAIENRITMICNRSGLANPLKPTIKNKSFLW